MRTIKIFTTNGVGGSVETNARTLGDLKPVLMERNISTLGMKMLVGETKNELSEDAAILPEGAFKLYLMPNKTKSGVDFEEMEENIEEIFSELESINAKLDTILNKLNNPIMSSTPSSTISAEDAASLEELRALSANAGRYGEF